MQTAQVENLGRGLNSKYVEFTPFITDDEKYLYFESNQPGQVGGRGFDLWFAENQADKGDAAVFNEARNVGEPINTRGFDGLPSLREYAPGLYEMYFTSKSSEDRKGVGRTDIYYSRQDSGGDWQQPRLLSINTEFDDLMPSISPDGKTLFFVSDRPGGAGKSDIYMSEKDADTGEFTLVTRLGKKINTRYDEATPAFHRDGKTLYLSSNRPGGRGGYDIYYATFDRKKRKVIGRLQNLGKPYNSIEDDEYPTITADGLRIYFASSRDGGFGSYDIYRARLPVFAPPGLQFISLLVQFQSPEEKLVTPQMVSYSIHPLAQEKSLRAERGEFREKIMLEPLRKKGAGKLKKLSLQLAARASGYAPVKKEYEIRDLSSRQREAGHLPVSLLVTLQPEAASVSKSAEREKIATIYFKTSVYKKIKKQEQRKLAAVVEKFRARPGNTVIKLFGHADRRNTYRYNMRLSKKRARQVKRQLVKLGIPAGKIKTRGFGYTRPAKKGRNKKAYRANRRVTIYFQD